MSRKKVLDSCDFAACGRRATHRGYCQAHYVQHRDGKTLTPLQPKVRVRWEGEAKLCPSCDKYQDAAHFGRDRNRKDGTSLVCKTCAAAYRAANREAILASQLKRFYNMTLDQFESMVAAQHGLCAICGKPPSDKGQTRLSVDHDHRCCPGSKSCGKCVRGLLCRPCNSMLGYGKDDPQRLRAGVSYLERYLPGL